MNETIRRMQHFFAYRPASVALICLVVGIYTAGGGLHYAVTVAAILAAGLLLSLLLKRKSLSLILLALLCGIAAGCAALMPEFTAPEPTVRSLSGQVCAVDIETVTLRKLRSDSGRTVGKAQMERDEETSFSVGDEVTFTGVLSLPELTRRRNLQSKGIYWTAEDVRIETVEKPERPGLIAAIDHLRANVDQRLERLYPESSALMKALLTGRDESMSYNQVEALRTAGISHLTVASGLHMAVVTGAAYWILKKLRLLRGARMTLAVVCAFTYCLLTGFTPSMLRAGGMLSFAMIAKAIGRDADGFNLLCLTACGMLLLWPMDVYSISFQLSVCAVGGLIGLSRAIKKVFGFLPEKWADALSAPLAAQLGTLPISLYWFGTVSVFSWPVNLIAVPVAGLLLILGMIGLVIGALPFAPQFLTVRLTDMLAKALTDGAEMIADIPGTAVTLTHWSWLFSFALGLALLLLTAVINSPPIRPEKADAAEETEKITERITEEKETREPDCR